MIHKGIQINETTRNNTHETHTQAISSHQSVSNKNVYYREETVGSGVEPDNYERLYLFCHCIKFVDSDGASNMSAGCKQI